MKKSNWKTGVLGGLTIIIALATGAKTYLVSEMDKVIFQQRQPRRWSAQVGTY